MGAIERGERVITLEGLLTYLNLKNILYKDFTSHPDLHQRTGLAPQFTVAAAQ